MTKQILLPGWFLHFIGVCEVLGALGLIVPRLFRIPGSRRVKAVAEGSRRVRSCNDTFRSD